MSYLDYQKALVQVASLLGDKVFIEYQNYQRPNPPYVGISFLSLIKATLDYKTAVDEDGKQRIVSNNFLNVTFSYYDTGDGSNITAIEKLSELDMLFKTEAARTIMDDAKIAYLGKLSAINFLPEIVESGFEPRAVMDLQFTAGSYIEEDVGLIEHVEGTGTINDEIIVNYRADKQ